jgi:hypothetical protein
VGVLDALPPSSFARSFGGLAEGGTPYGELRRACLEIRGPERGFRVRLEFRLQPGERPTSLAAKESLLRGGGAVGVLDALPPEGGTPYR